MMILSSRVLRLIRCHESYLSAGRTGRAVYKICFIITKKSSFINTKNLQQRFHY